MDKGEVKTMPRTPPNPDSVPRFAGRWRPPMEATVAVLELTAAEDPDLFDFTAHALANSCMSFAVRTLAGDLSVTPQSVGLEIARACRQLDQLEKQHRVWRDPAEVVDAPNLKALRHVCRARLDRTSPGARHNRLNKVRRRLEAAWELARTRAFIEDFIGPQPGEARHTNR